MKLSKRERKAAQIDLYLRQVGRPAQKGREPNDRSYDRGVEREMEKLKPEELEALLRGDDDS